MSTITQIIFQQFHAGPILESLHIVWSNWQEFQVAVIIRIQNCQLTLHWTQFWTFHGWSWSHSASLINSKHSKQGKHFLIQRLNYLNLEIIVREPSLMQYVATKDGIADTTGIMTGLPRWAYFELTRSSLPSTSYQKMTKFWQDKKMEPYLA